MRKQKGITLVALILTIVILLILAVVTITSITGEGVIDKAKNARDSYEGAADDENSMLSNYSSLMDNIILNSTLY